MVHLQFSLTQLKSDPEATLCSFLFIILAENLTADETESVRVDSKEDNEVCHFLRSVQALWVNCDVYSIVLYCEGLMELTDSHKTAKKLAVRCKLTNFNCHSLKKKITVKIILLIGTKRK